MLGGRYGPPAVGAEVQKREARAAGRWGQSVVKNIPKCEKSVGKEEKAEAFRCDNYARLLGTGRRVLLAPICALQCQTRHQAPTTNIPFLSHPQTIVLEGREVASKSCLGDFFIFMTELVFCIF